jgi:hypothetical protein
MECNMATLLRMHFIRESASNSMGSSKVTVNIDKTRRLAITSRIKGIHIELSVSFVFTST